MSSLNQSLPGAEDRDRDLRIFRNGKREAIGEIRADLHVLVSAFADVPEAVRILKIGEEFGEATEAYIGVEGLNPRKGTTHTREDVAKELADVAITALVALGAFTDDPFGKLTGHLRWIRERHEAMEASRGA